MCKGYIMPLFCIPLREFCHICLNKHLAPVRHLTVVQGVGAASVEYLVHSPMIRQAHFHRVILMSGSMFSSWARVHNPADTAVRLARELGCPLPADLHTHHTNILDCLRLDSFQL